LREPPNQAGNDCIALLDDLAQTLNGHVRKKTVLLYGGVTLTRQLRGLYREHKIELLANHELVLTDVEASYGRFELLQINPRTKFHHGTLARTITTTSANHMVFTLEGELSPAQAELYESGILRRLLDVIVPGEGEEINISQRLVRVYLRRPNINRVTTIIDAVIDLMPHERGAPAAFGTFPETLRPLAPLLARWAIDDDDERSRKLKRCARSTRQKLVDAVIPLLPTIDSFLDSFGPNPPEEACALGSLAQAALEAQSLLRDD
jgi:hypothetical protein